jgi:hypothetical protein
VVPRHPLIAAPAIFLVLFFITGNTIELPYHHSKANLAWNNDKQLYGELNAMELGKDTKLYASPPNHLILSFYTGLPFQNITPVRKSFLNSYKGDVVFVDSAYSRVDYAFSDDEPLLAPESIQKTVLARGQKLDLMAAEHWSHLLRTRDYRESIQKIVMGTETAALEEIPPAYECLLAADRKHARAYFLASTRELMTRGFELENWLDWRAVVSYRFVDPDSRRGRRSNFAERLRGAHAMLLVRSDKVIFLSRWHEPGIGKKVDFEILP